MTTKSQLLQKIRRILRRQPSIWLKEIGSLDRVDAIVLGEKRVLKPLLEGEAE